MLARRGHERLEQLRSSATSLCRVRDGERHLGDVRLVLQNEVVRNSGDLSSQLRNRTEALNIVNGGRRKLDRTLGSTETKETGVHALRRETGIEMEEPLGVFG